MESLYELSLTNVGTLIQTFSNIVVHNRVLTIFLVLATFAALFVIYCLVRISRFLLNVRTIGKEVDKLPGREKHYFWGHLKQLPAADDPRRFTVWEKGTAEFPRIQKVWIGPVTPIVSLCHPDTMKTIMKSSEPKYTDRISGYPSLLPWIGEGLLLSSGAKWFRNRRLLTPAFHFDILKDYIPIYNQSADIMLDKLSGESDTGTAVDISKTVSLCTLDTILKCAFSQDLDVQRQGSNHPYVRAVLELSELTMARLRNPFVRFSDFLYMLTSNGKRAMENGRCAHETADRLIQDRRKTLAEEEKDVTEKKRYLDFLDILLTARDENGEGLSDLEIRNEVDTFLFEGHDTTASGISWALYYLAKHPDAQEKAWKEIDALLGPREDLKLQDLSNLPYLMLCIKEVLRMTPPVPTIGRQLTRPIEVEGVTLRPGTSIGLNIHCLHHNPQVWGDDHMEFKPERFLHENMKNMDSYAYIPFSAGPRNCIGQNFAMNELKVMIAKVLHRFKLEVDPDYVPGPIHHLVVRAKHGFKFKFSQRI